MAHLKNECNVNCQGCVFCNWYRDGYASWYYCSIAGNAYDSSANSRVESNFLTCDDRLNYSCFRYMLNSLDIPDDSKERLHSLVIREGI